MRPNPFLDPMRLTWESAVVTTYEACATKHKLTVDAWRKAEGK